MKNLFITSLLLLLYIPSEAWSQNLQGRISRDLLIEDTRQLIAYLEDSHPDPYQGFGGKIMFHRNFQNILSSIPVNGMTSAEYYNLVMPFVAGMRDMHTGLINNSGSGITGPGLPLKLKIVEQDLVVMSVPAPDSEQLLGSRLISVQGIELLELRARQTRLRGIENSYGELVFVSLSLKTAKGIKSLIPEWNGTDALSCKFLLQTGKIISANFQLNQMKANDMVSIPSALANHPILSDHQRKIQN